MNNSLRKCLPILSSEAELALAQRQFRRAEGLFEELCKREPTAPLHWLNQCASLRALRKPVKACRVIKQGISIHPKHPLLRRALAQSLAEQGKQEKTQNLLLADIEEASRMKLSQKEIFNLQFLGSGYQLIDAEKLQNVAQAWEKHIQNLEFIFVMLAKYR